MKIYSLLLLVCISFSNHRCASSGNSPISSMMEERQEDDEDSPGDDRNLTGKISASTSIFTYSASNSVLSSRGFSPKRSRNLASELERRLRSPTVKNRRELVALMSLYRMAGGDLNQAFNIAKKISLNEMKVDISRKIPESAVLELALSSIQSANYSMADHWLNELSSSKDKKMQAAVETARGIIELRSGRLPEAIFYWNEALKKYSNYEPARLNIGFYALKFGDVTTAKRMLSTIESDYFVLTGLMQAERLSDRAKKVESMCDRLLQLNPKYKPALFSCGLNTYQGLSKLAEAKRDLEKVAQVEAPPVEIDEKVFLTIGKIEALQKSNAPNAPKK